MRGWNAHGIGTSLQGSSSGPVQWGSVLHYFFFPAKVQGVSLPFHTFSGALITLDLFPNSTGLSNTLMSDQGAAPTADNWSHFWASVGCYSAPSLSPWTDWGNGRNIGKHWQTRPLTLACWSLHVQQLGVGKRVKHIEHPLVAWPSATHIHTHFLVQVSQ